MSDEFEDRIREAIVVPLEGQLDPLREATKSAAGSLGSGEALDMVRAAHSQQISQEADLRLRRRFNAKEAVIAERGQMQMLATLSAITLIRVFGRPQYVPGLLPSLAVRAARNCDWQPVHPDLWAYADHYIRGRASVARGSVPPEEFRQVLKAEESPEPLKEIQALREAVLRDRDLRDESDHLLWWLLSRDQPRSTLDAALEFANLLSCIPEPIASEELLRTKLSRPVPTDRSRAWVFQMPEVPPELTDLCTELSAGRGEEDGDLSLDRVYALLNEILLIRALEQRPIER